MHLDNDAVSQLIESNKTLESEELFKLKTILDKIMDIDNQKKNWFKF